MFWRRLRDGVETLGVGGERARLGREWATGYRCRTRDDVIGRSQRRKVRHSCPLAGRGDRTLVRSGTQPENNSIVCLLSGALSVSRGVSRGIGLGFRVGARLELVLQEVSARQLRTGGPGRDSTTSRWLLKSADWLPVPRRERSRSNLKQFNGIIKCACG